MPTENKINGSIVKAFDVLEHFTPQKPKWGVRALAKTMQANKSTVYRLLATLESLGVLTKTPDDHYCMGLKLFELGNRVNPLSAITQLSRPALDQVAAIIKENVHLGILNNAKVLMVDKAESPMGLKLNSRVGAYSELYCTGLGKMLLASLSDNSLDRIISELSFEKHTPHTICNKNDLWAAIKLIRNQGYALDREELELGLICVAIPVYNQEGEVIAAISASGPANRFREDAIGEYTDMLKIGADAIQTGIGYFNWT